MGAPNRADKGLKEGIARKGLGFLGGSVISGGLWETTSIECLPGGLGRSGSTRKSVKASQTCGLVWGVSTQFVPIGQVSPFGNFSLRSSPVTC